MALKMHRLVLGELQTNCYILADDGTKEAMVIDAPDDAKTIVKMINENGYKLKQIVLTHGHFDHILALADLAEMTGAPVAIHHNGAEFLRDNAMNLAHYIGRDPEAFEADSYLKDGDVLKLGNEKLKVIHTPGHTSDCICLLCGKILISGDTLFRGSVGRVDHPTGNLKQEVESVKTKLMPLDDDVEVYPGHGPYTTIGNERRNNPYVKE